MDKRFLTILGVIVIIIAGIFVVTQKSSDKTNTKSSSNTPPTSHIEGEGQKGVTLIEYGDYECPACEAYYPIVKQVQQAYSSQIYFQFRNFPLDSIHPNARSGARAAEAAALQGKFWEMHDALYDHQSDWGNSSNPLPFLDTYAQQIGLDMTKYHKDYSSDAVNASINADIAEGQKIKADSTPTFVLDGKKIESNPQSLQAFNDLISSEIAKKNPASTPTQ